MKKFINSTANVVDDSINGLIRANCLLGIHPKNGRVVLRNDLNILNQNSVVTLVSGGGSGHEPFAAGYVGKNALTTSVSGDIFASPSTCAVMTAIRAVCSDAGTIVFVINYTGDRLNFGIAVERIKAQTSHRIALIYIDDDVALEHKSNVATGGRGLAGVAMLIHLVGIFSEQYKIRFEELVGISQKIIANLATFGVNLEPCALPGQAKMFELSKDEYELGLGSVHGESGIERKQMTSAKEICAELLGRLIGCKRLNLQKNDPLAVLLNNLGSVSQLEMGILKNEIINWFVSNNYNVQCFISGTLMTSIDSHGFSITILRLIDEKWLSCLLEGRSAISTLWTASKINQEILFKSGEKGSIFEPEQIDVELGPKLSHDIQIRVKLSLEEACKSLIAMEHELNRLDSSVGDGDCGTSMKMAANSILNSIEKGQLAFSHPKNLFLQLSRIFESSIGGTSGALYALMMNAASVAFDKPLSSEVFKEALNLALNNVMYYGGAKPGHRTLVDPLEVAANFPSENWRDIVNAVVELAKQTAQMEAKAGRASYTNKSQQLEPDPGAMAFATWFRAIYDRFEKF